MKPDEKTRTQEAFMASKNMIVVATIAFGMGIDKSDIRSVRVVHLFFSYLLTFLPFHVGSTLCGTFQSGEL
jgi:superfamily II DNA helicase RecQ